MTLLRQREARTILEAPVARRVAYPEYRDSGIEWLGMIPSHWRIVKLKYIFQVFNGATPKSAEETYWDGDIIWITPEDLGNLASRSIFTSGRRITLEGYLSCGTTLAPVGSLVISTRAPIGHVAIAASNLCTNQGCRALTFRIHSDSLYFYYVLITYKSELQSLGQGSTFTELSSVKLANVDLILPPLDEQRAIAAFLDRQTAKIDALIAKKRELINALQEKRSALISHVVTKGLDPDAPMKDSGIEWLGEIPAGWEIKRLKFLAQDVNHQQTKDAEFDISLQLEDVEGWSGRYTVSKTSNSTFDGGDKAFQPDDVLFSKLRPYLAKAVVSKHYGRCVGEFWVLRVKENLITPKFLAFRMLTKEFINNVNASTYGAKMPRANWDFVGNMQIPLPTLDEQRGIVVYLDSETGKIDALIAKAEATIERLQEYRSSLISAAVTGKIDVRTGQT